MTGRSPSGRATHEPGLASRPGHSVGVPNAPLQPVAGFIDAIADRFQEMHIPPLERDRAILMAVRTIREAEADLAPFGHPDFDWSLDGARVLADEQIEHWERTNDAA